MYVRGTEESSPRAKIDLLHVRMRVVYTGYQAYIHVLQNVMVRLRYLHVCARKVYNC